MSRKISSSPMTTTSNKEETVVEWFISQFDEVDILLYKGEFAAASSIVQADVVLGRFIKHIVDIILFLVVSFYGMLFNQMRTAKQTSRTMSSLPIVIHSINQLYHFCTIKHRLYFATEELKQSGGVLVNRSPADALNDKAIQFPDIKSRGDVVTCCCLGSTKLVITFKTAGLPLLGVFSLGQNEKMSWTEEHVEAGCNTEKISYYSAITGDLGGNVIYAATSTFKIFAFMRKFSKVSSKMVWHGVLIADLQLKVGGTIMGISRSPLLPLLAGVTKAGDVFLVDLNFYRTKVYGLAKARNGCVLPNVEWNSAFAALQTLLVATSSHFTEFSFLYAGNNPTDSKKDRIATIQIPFETPINADVGASILCFSVERTSGTRLALALATNPSYVHVYRYGFHKLIYELSVSLDSRIPQSLNWNCSQTGASCSLRMISKISEDEYEWNSVEIDVTSNKNFPNILI